MSLTTKSSLLAAAVLAAACTSPSEPAGDDVAGDSTGATEAPPLELGQIVPFPTDEWTVLPPEDVGMDPDVLQGAFDYAFAPGKNTQGVVIIRGGAIVAERYAAGKDASSNATSWSAGKSFASTMVGVAVTQGLIADANVPMTDFYPQWAGTDKKAIALRDVLQAQSGHNFVEDYADLGTEFNIIKMATQPDALDYIVNQVDMAHEPGTKWYYSSGDTMLLSGVVEAATGKTVAEYAAETLFGPLGMDEASWWVDGAGHTQTWCCVDAPTREFAKLGLLFLRGGDWDGNRIVSEQWVRDATTDTASNYPGYAYQWWTAELDPGGPLPRDMYVARGYDDQRIYVIPSLDLVVARHSMYNEPPGPKVADKGMFLKMQGRDFSTYGTSAADSWLDIPFLAPIINSIEGAEKIEDGTGAGGEAPDDPGLCREKAAALGGFCEPIHGCVCETCAKEFLTCEQHQGCREIVECALRTGCRSVECVSACEEAINYNGGPFGEAAGLATDLDECQAPCATNCDGSG